MEIEKAIEKLKQSIVTLDKSLEDEEIKKAIDLGIVGCNFEELKQSGLEFKEIFDLAIETLEKQLNGGWISCKERLPSYDDTYIVSDGKDIFIMNYDMCLGWGKYKFNKKSITFKESKCNVIAWQEKPKSYKEEIE
jgi:hypothetical protein